jgi:hypothetical protein
VIIESTARDETKEVGHASQDAPPCPTEVVMADEHVDPTGSQHALTVEQLTLEDLVLAYMSQALGSELAPGETAPPLATATAKPL